MKGNRSADGVTLPGTPFDWSPAVVPALAAGPELVAQPIPKQSRLRRRAVVLWSVASIAVAAVVTGVAIAFSGGESTTGNGFEGGPGESAGLAMPGTPTHTPERTATLAPGGPPAADSPGTTPAAMAGSTAASAARVRYEVAAGDTCEALREKFGFPATASEDFALALMRVSGRPPASGCDFGQSDVVCIPTPADLQQLDTLARDAACLLGVTPAAGS